jgi:hypothetical protein
MSVHTFLSRAQADLGMALPSNKGIVSKLIVNRERAEAQFMEAE